MGLAPGAGFEPATIRLTVECSTAELSGNRRNRRSQAGLRITKAFAVAKDEFGECARIKLGAETAAQQRISGLFPRQMRRAHPRQRPTPCCVLTSPVPKDDRFSALISGFSHV